jgi:hypothetical protein
MPFWVGRILADTHCTNAADGTVVQKHKVEAAAIMSQPEQSSDAGGVAAAGVLQGKVMRAW